MKLQKISFSNNLTFGLFVLSIILFSFKPNHFVYADSALPEITVYKSPICGCCGKWVSHLESNGFKVTAINQDNMNSIKQQLGIAPNLQSCHTAKVGNYFVEGHVPAADIKKMLAEQPNIQGLSVPGMPIGSPGMEVGTRKDKYEVLTVNKDKSVSVYSRY